MDSDEALALVAHKLEAAYQPADDSHTLEWVDLYIGHSTMVHKTAFEYAKKIFDKNYEEADEEKRYYGFRGNALGDASLKKFPHREIRFEVPLKNGWRWVGHLDAAEAHGDLVVAVEVKSYTNPTRSKMDIAFRQGAGGLAGMRHLSSKTGDVEFPVATFARDTDSRPFVWRAGFKPAGVVVGVAPYNPPATIRRTPTAASDLDEIFQFYFQKASAILESVLTGDLAHAQKWDDDHPTEFLVPFSDIPDGLPEMEELGRQIADIKKKLRPAGLNDDEVDDLDDELKRLRALANLTMGKAELRSGVFAGIRFTRIVVQDKVVPAQPETIKSGFSYVKAAVA